MILTIWFKSRLACMITTSPSFFDVIFNHHENRGTNQFGGFPAGLLEH